MEKRARFTNGTAITMPQPFYSRGVMSSVKHNKLQNTGSGESAVERIDSHP